MRWNQHLQIPKKQKQVTLWIHPEGKIVGSLFLSLQNKYYLGVEEPLEALNHPEPFLALRHEECDELRFYNKTAIIRLEYHEESRPVSDGIELLHCRLYLMDGSVLEGTVSKALPPDHARLYDYLNMDDERFAEIYTKEGIVYLINKSYIVWVTSLSEKSHGDAERQSSEVVASNRLA
jgi:hypothetical protein